jgi:hypothetical protein
MRRQPGDRSRGSRGIAISFEPILPESGALFVPNSEREQLTADERCEGRSLLA